MQLTGQCLQLFHGARWVQSDMVNVISDVKARILLPGPAPQEPLVRPETLGTMGNERRVIDELLHEPLGIGRIRFTFRFFEDNQGTHVIFQERGLYVQCQFVKDGEIFHEDLLLNSPCFLACHSTFWC
jgi:hypothetical protein